MSPLSLKPAPDSDDHGPALDARTGPHFLPDWDGPTVLCFSKPPWLSSDFFKSRFLHPSTTLRRSTATGYQPNSYTTISAITNAKNRDPRLSPRLPIRVLPPIASAYSVAWNHGKPGGSLDLSSGLKPGTIGRALPRNAFTPLRSPNHAASPTRPSSAHLPPPPAAPPPPSRPKNQPSRTPLRLQRRHGHPNAGPAVLRRPRRTPAARLTKPALGPGDPRRPLSPPSTPPGPRRAPSAPPIPAASRTLISPALLPPPATAPPRPNGPPTTPPSPRPLG
jgi:hypothetical protein